jgi:Cu(I)/Ag(I) efflux system protein CusF
MKAKRFAVIVLPLSLAIGASVAFAQGALVDGEVKKIDGAAGKISLKHGPIKNLDMDAMTMVLRVKDRTMLKNVKVGDKVKFEAERAPEGITITKMEKAKERKKR